MKPLLLAGWLVAFCGDAITTQKAMHQGAVEITMPTQNPVAINGILAGETLIGYWAYRKWHVSHPRLTRILYVVGVSSHGSAALWNLHQLR